MAYTNSNLISYTKLSPSHSGQRTHSIDHITPHCAVGQLSAESICRYFTSPSKQASCNYGIDKDGRTSLCVEEESRSQCSSSDANDQRAATIECASNMSEPYVMNSAVYNSLIKFYTDVYKCNRKMKPLWLADKNKTLDYAPKSDEMVLTVHRWFTNKSCSGNWLYSRFGGLVTKVISELSKTASGDGTAFTSQMHRVRKTWSDSKSQLGIYETLANARKGTGENAGYKVFDVSGNTAYPTATKPAKIPAANTSYRVQIGVVNSNIRKRPDTNYGKIGQPAGKGIFAIVQESKGEGAILWGRLKSGAGWISLGFAKKI